MKQNGPLCVLMGRGRPHVTPHTQEAGLMRLSVASLRRLIKGNLHVDFVRQELTSYSGLEVLRRYLRQRELPSRLRAACAATGGDYGGGRLARARRGLALLSAPRFVELRSVSGITPISLCFRVCRQRAPPTAAHLLR